MSQAEYDELKASIREHGQRVKIMAIGSEIIDGMNRYNACLDVGKTPWVEQYVGNTPVQFVKEMNLHRRMLDATQRATIEATLNEWLEHGSRVTEFGTGAELPLTSAQMASSASVSERTIVDAKTAIKAGFTELLKSGEIAAKPAAELARKAPEVAARVVAKEITPAQGKAELKEREAKPSPRTFGPTESEKFAELQAEKAKLEAALADKNAEIIALELAGVDEGARNEAMDKMQGYIDAIDNADRMRKAAEALLSEANHKANELVRANNALDAQNKKLKARIAELERCVK
jgi:hypothetical protein